jgi:broad specificity phosphatase PhoE
MKIYFVRHGESEGNAGKTWQSNTSPLNEKGIKQAQMIADRISSIDFDVLVSSDLIRAKQTAEFISQKTDKEIVESALFAERRKPSNLIGQSRLSQEAIEISQKYYDAFLSNQKYEDGESFEELIQRVKDALSFLENLNAKNIVVVTHGMFLRVICAYVILKNYITPRTCFEFICSLRTQNTGITLIEKDEESEWRLTTWNDHAHFAE